MRLGGDISYRADLQAGGLQRPDRGLAARARALHEYIDLLTAALLRFAGGVLGGQLGGDGVDFREPLKPTLPDEAQAMTLPCRSVIVTIVLLNVLLMWAAPCGTFFFSRAAGSSDPSWRGAAAAFLAGGMTYFAFFLPAMVRLGPLRVRALVLVR